MAGARFHLGAARGGAEQAAQGVSVAAGACSWLSGGSSRDRPAPHALHCRQDVERHNELQRSVMATVAVLRRMEDSHTCPKFQVPRRADAASGSVSSALISDCVFIVFAVCAYVGVAGDVRCHCG